MLCKAGNRQLAIQLTMNSLKHPAKKEKRVQPLNHAAKMYR
jgi:hypothetical protein